MSRIWVGAIAIALLGAFAIGTGAAAPLAGARPAVGVFKGHFREAGGPPPGSPRPLRGHIYLRAGGHHVATFRVHRHGRFRGSVPPGRYQVFGRSPKYGDNTVRCPAAHPIHVRANQVVHINVSCQVP